MSVLKGLARRLPFFDGAARKIHDVLKAPKGGQKPFPGSQIYWEERYAKGGNSGAGSYHKLAEFKAQVLNSFVEEEGIGSVIEFGCGDGNQLALANYAHYIGFDVSRTAIARCREMYNSDSSKTFFLLDEYAGQTADLTLSLDVVYHLVEDDIFDEHMHLLFDSATRYVAIYSSNTDEDKGSTGSHVWHRKFSTWIDEKLWDWSLKQYIPNRYPYKGDHTDTSTETSFADFYIYERPD
jgi:SAM-dependent methyltransferase